MPFRNKIGTKFLLFKSMLVFVIIDKIREFHKGTLLAENGEYGKSFINAIIPASLDVNTLHINTTVIKTRS